MFRPIFPPKLLEASQLLGFSLTLQNPVKARLVVRCKSASDATELARLIKNEPQNWLEMEDSDLLLYAQPPEIESEGTDLQLRFDVPEKTARLLLQRIAKTDAPPVPGRKLTRRRPDFL